MTTSVEQLLESIDKLLNVPLSCITLQHDIELDIYTNKKNRQTAGSQKSDHRRKIREMIAGNY